MPQFFLNSISFLLQYLNQNNADGASLKKSINDSGSCFNIFSGSAGKSGGSGALFKKSRRGYAPLPDFCYG